MVLFTGPSINFMAMGGKRQRYRLLNKYLPNPCGQGTGAPDVARQDG